MFQSHALKIFYFLILSYTIIPLHPLSIFPASYSINPVLIIYIPLNGHIQSLFKSKLLLPPQLIFYLITIYGIPSIISWSILNKSNQSPIRTFLANNPIRSVASSQMESLASIHSFS